MRPLVIDTNVVLDAFVFSDARTVALVDALDSGRVQWLATQAMRDELERVLAYPHIVKKLEFYGLQPGGVLSRFDRHALLHEEAPRAPVVCKDEDDQKFIDLAVQHRAQLVSKDREVLKMNKRIQKLGCPAVAPAYTGNVNEFSLAAGQ
ncbi:putative toxin-antitoxin system toxin component, PIN family [Ramlibacter albus]|uniref:Toxin-antitoxin system toxin component, PIN family n=1 Tax=Ramlibacter albus TaxID=2079448 RepID=A0A923S1B1_9BURK|nr:putative toxin-antitoxin system toxin component, PIN family [Ramlibacter albus]MBC5764105.1 putative toxin-antitoxin system toxin component, PIN family [Ramlibacter albus]